MSSQER